MRATFKYSVSPSSVARSEAQNYIRNTPNRVRFSIGAFNTEAHVDAAINAMTEIAERARKMAAIRSHGK